MRVGICEDQTVESNWLANLIKSWADMQDTTVEIIQYEHAEQFWFDYETRHLDALFLDIVMPGENGITLAKKLRDKGDSVPIVFVTGEKEYVLAGYEVEAVHYLIKPVKKSDVSKCMDRITLRMKDDEPVVMLETPQAVVRVRQKDIIKIEVFGHNLIYTTSSGTYEIRTSLKECLSMLHEDWFIQCYRGVLVNLWHVERIDREQVILDVGQAPVSRRLYGEVNQAFISFYKNRH